MVVAINRNVNSLENAKRLEKVHAFSFPFASPMVIFFWKSVFFLFFVTALLSADEFSFDDEESSNPTADPIRFELLTEETSIQPGRPFWIALHLDIDEHWHSYWKHPGDIGMPTRVEWELPEGFEVSNLEWPFPKRFEQNGFIGFGFENKVTLLAQITPPTSLTSDTSAMLGANIRWLVCSDLTCLPGETVINLEVPISDTSPKEDAKHQTFFSEARALLPKMQWHMHAHIQNDLIELQIQAPGYKHLTAAYFCPSERKVIDSKSDTALAPLEEKPGFYVLYLKAIDGKMPDRLKGVLVVESESGPEAIELNLPLNTASSEISMNSNSKPPSAEFASIEVEAPRQPEPESIEFDGGIGLAILFAFMGGFILNLMPCVLPVVSFKILSFVKMAGQSRALIFKHGMAFSAGVLISFWILAGLMLMLQAYGQSVGWGFQLQEPLFVAILAALLFLFALSLFGVFELGVSVTALAGKVGHQSHSSELVGSFLSGMLATAVATPCTGPFLGSAIGFAVTLPTVWALIIFTSLGLGMAFPYLLMAAFPSLLRYMPKPGAWMETFKEMLGFVMLATVLWLVWVFSAQTNSFSIFILLVSFFILAVGAWIYGHWGTPRRKRSTRIISSILALACLLTAGYAITLSASPMIIALEEELSNHQEEWETFSPERVAELQAAGIPVLIDFTAKWCLICQANHLVLSLDQVESKIQEKGVVKMKADWTKNDPVITKALKQYGRNGVPLYVLYSNDSRTQPAILPQVLTPDLVVEYLEPLNPSIALK